MPKGYLHLAHDERCQIYALKKSGLSNSQIAIQLDRARSTIGREVKRNSGRRGYRHQQAQRRTYERRKAASSVPGKMTPGCVSKVVEIVHQRSPNGLICA